MDVIVSCLSWWFYFYGQDRGGWGMTDGSILSGVPCKKCTTECTTKKCTTSINLHSTYGFPNLSRTMRTTEEIQISYVRCNIHLDLGSPSVLLVRI